jgi:hypothetical protein
MKKSPNENHHLVTRIYLNCFIIPKWEYDLGVNSGNHNLGQMITYQILMFDVRNQQLSLHQYRYQPIPIPIGIDWYWYCYIHISIQ